jgi:hypothetical protein
MHRRSVPPTRAHALAQAVLLRVAVPLSVAVEAGVRRSVLRGARRGDRGDVPGWVLVTLMTAGLVTALWVLARDRLTEVFDKAITSVAG